FVALALDDLEEGRADDVGGEDLQEDALLVGAVDEDAAAPQLLERLFVPRDAVFDGAVISVRRVLEVAAARPQRVAGGVDVGGGDGEVLDAFAAVLAQVLFDLRAVVLRLVDGDLDLAAGAGERAGEEAALLALDVEVADLAEVE